jgi:hypothetical protein
MRNSFSTSGSRVVETASRVIGDKSPRLDTQRILRHDFPCDATQTTSSVATQADVAFQRQFRFTEQLNLRFRPEFFKLFGQSTQTLASYLGTGGQSGGFNPLYQIGGPRSIQLALKLQF